MEIYFSEKLHVHGQFIKSYSEEFPVYAQLAGNDQTSGEFKILEVDMFYEMVYLELKVRGPVFSLKSCNLVVSTNSGEAESLYGKIDPKTFGDRSRTIAYDEFKLFRKRDSDSSLYSEPLRHWSVYQSRRKETRDAYEAMLTIIEKELGGGQPLDIVAVVADEILNVLKIDVFVNSKEEIERVLGGIRDDVFDQFVLLGRVITDYGGGDDGELGDDPFDEDVGVSVEFEENKETDLDMVLDDEDDCDDDLADGNGSGAMHMGGGIFHDDDQEVVENDGTRTLNVQDIDAYWLQRKISQAYDQQQQQIDPQQSQKLAEEVFKILAEGGDDRQVETKLLVHLWFDKFSLVKYLLKNRMYIVWCIRLARTQDQDERKKVEEEMMQLGPDLVVILEQLHATRATAKERQTNLEKSIRQEAHRLKDDGDHGRRGTLDRDADIVWSKGQRQLLDLESLAFSQGGLFMANRKCELPSGSYRKHNKDYEVHVPALKPKPLADGEELIRVSSQNLLLCAPTGAAITRLFVAPMKALVAEVVGNLSNRMKHYGVQVKELSGDQTLTRQQIEETQIIVTTPEKWDIITRKSGDRTYTQLVKLLIIDEIHLLHDKRGPVLESIVARTVRQIETTKEHTRLVGLSATLSNFEDVALFLRVDLKKGLFHFDSSYRPCPLAQQYIGITTKKPLQRFWLMNDVCYEKVVSVAGKHQVLIFVHSRKETEKTARAIRDSALTNDTVSRFLKEESATREILQEHTELVKSNDLKDLLPYGFAIHHAGLNRADRQIVEELFADGHIQVLVSTATLAWGVNLPAHTVIIKGTQIYNPERGAWTELSPLDVVQMLGRVGRPQYDTCGEGKIITGHSPDALSKDILLEERRAGLVHTAAAILEKNSLIRYDRRSGFFQVTDLGRTASHYYISHGTICTYNEHLKPMMGDIELYHLFSSGEEFKYVTVRQDEKMELAKLINRVPIPIKENLEEPSAKINVLLQAYISRLKLEGLSLTSDMVYISQNAGCLARALFEIALKRGRAQVAEKALNLCKMVCKRMWTVQSPLRQFLGLPRDVLMKMEKKDLTWERYYWERYYDLSSNELGEIFRFGRMGKALHKCIHQFPKFVLAAHIMPITRAILRVELTVTPDFQWEDEVHGYVEPFWVFVEDSYGELILHHQFFLLKKQYIDEDHTLIFTVPIYEPLHPQYFIRVVSDKWIGSQTVLPVYFRYLVLPEKYPPTTELLDLQPLPVTALRNLSYESLYQEYKHFNPVQTQVFTALYNTDDNVLVAAPTGSGKMICAEFAIMRNHLRSDHDVMRAVYIAPVESLAKVRYNDWNRKFGKGLGMRVVELTGETAMDLELLEKGQLIISTPDKWDALSRRWKQHKHVRQVSLFIIDELHLIGGYGGPILEVIVSRMRYIASQVENKIRIVALSTSLANAKDLGEGIGASSQGLFNFPPGVRPVPLEIHIQSVDIDNFEARMRAMTKPTYTSIIQRTKNGKPAIVFVPTRKHVWLTAVDLMTYSTADSGNNPMFIVQCAEELKPFVDKINEAMLRETLQCGVGFLHEGLTSNDQDIVRTLFESGWIQVCVMSSSMCWGMPLRTHLVIIMGTQFHDGRENVDNGYPVTDILQMMGQASRPLVDDSGKCVVFCHVPQKEYYKKFLHEGLPVESHLHHFLHDNLNTEVAARFITNKQDAVDYLTWTLMYRMLTQNPNYYNLQGVSQRHLSDHLSELVENTLRDLETRKCVSIEDISSESWVDCTVSLC
ncbi:hypothetical protein POM88_032847 [Heracleum sosnowskyi]|uniref:RNA helicase n=1 Tax=Heracleum sosnowskyi TaxID=360622 RepID=A0AAD8ML97_9APIA|nr:hypothetical protein POM88_032847 [Heracleum sosnowskyi]